MARRVTKREQRKLRRGCEGKQAHADKEAARKHAEFLRRRDGAMMTFYRCPACGAWHVGHTPRSVRQSLRDRYA